jgi:uncharacterized membrane protein YcaP (DUF421 family)
MWHAMFAGQIPLAEKILRTVIVYGLLAVLFRLTGKQGLASMNTFDFVVIFLLSSVAQNAVIGNDTSLIGGIIGAVTWSPSTRPSTGSSLPARPSHASSTGMRPP